MKQIFILIAIAISGICNGQALTIQNSESTIKEEGQNKVYYKTITVTGIPANQSTIEVAIANTDLSATFNKDYSFLSTNGIGKKTLTALNNIITVGIIVNADEFLENDEKFILTYSYDSLTVHRSLNDTITIKDINASITHLPDTTKWSVRIVTGSNFDFFDAPTFKNYAGDLNIFLPNLIKPIFKDKRIGLNLGVFNYRYYDSDSSGSNIVTENYLIDPTIQRIAVDTTKYVRDIYYLNSKTTYNNVGLYFNPMIELSSDKWYDLYLELHFEVIWRTQILSYSQQSIRKDTFTIRQSDILTRGVFQDFKGIRSLYQKTSYFDNYFGLGLPFKANIKKAFELFVTPSLGVSSFKETVTSTDDKLSIRSRTITEKTNLQPYFLTKFQLTTTVAPIDITLGGEYRNVFNQKSFFGMYLGAAISLNKLKK